jgi:hypothetical protein
MKQRFSLRKANWSETREVSYKEYCDKILFDRHQKLVIDDNRVYLKSAEGERLLLEIIEPKSTWYEIWLQLK